MTKEHLNRIEGEAIRNNRLIRAKYGKQVKIEYQRPTANSYDVVTCDFTVTLPHGAQLNGFISA